VSVSDLIFELSMKLIILVLEWMTPFKIGNRILCSGLRCLNSAIGQCGDNGSGRMTGVPLKSEFIFFICVIIVMCHSKIQTNKNPV
jgi:hypothetical protein